MTPPQDSLPSSGIAASKSGPDVHWQPSPYFSKTFAAYFSSTALAAAAPYYKTLGSRNKLEQHFNKALRELNKINDKKFQMYVELKINGWYYKFPPASRSPCRVQGRTKRGMGRKWTICNLGRYT